MADFGDSSDRREQSGRSGAIDGRERRGVWFKPRLTDNENMQGKLEEGVSADGKRETKRERKIIQRRRAKKTKRERVGARLERLNSARGWWAGVFPE